MNALRRQLSASGWQAVGFFGALAVFAAVTYLWGSGIESDLDQVIVERERDHRVLQGLVADAREVSTPSELQIDPKLGDGNGNREEGVAPASGGSGGRSEPGEAAPSPAGATDPRHEPQPEPGQGGSGGEAGPPAAAPTTPPTSAPAQPVTPTQPQPIREGVQSVLEDAGSTVSETGEAVNGLLCGVQERLLGGCP